MPTGQILQPGSARTARRDRTYLGNLFATPHTRSTLPHSVFCLRLSCPLVPNPAGKQAALKKIKMRKESDAGHLFLNFLLFNICQVGYFPAPFQNGPRDSIVQLCTIPSSSHPFNGRENEKQTMLQIFVFVLMFVLRSSVNGCFTIRIFLTSTSPPCRCQK